MRTDPVAFTTLLFLLKATGVLLLTIAAATLLRRASAGTRHTVWLTALVLIVALPLLATALPDWRVLPITPASEGLVDGRAGSHQGLTPWSGESGTDAAPPQAAPASGPVDVAAAANAGAAESTPEMPGSGVGPGSADPAAVLLALWALGTLIVLGRLGRSALRLRRILAEATVLNDSDWTTPLWEAADRLNLTEAPRLLRSERVTMPFACGLLRPTIVVPGSAAGWSEARRRAVLFHELAHIRRRDLLGHTLGRLACGLYWMHPLVWTAARRLRAESERACDDLVLSTGTPASEYADHLLQILVGVRRNDAPAVALPMGRRREVEGRLLAILDPALRRHGSTLGHVGILAGLSLSAAALIAIAPVEAADGRLAAAPETDALESWPGAADSQVRAGDAGPGESLPSRGVPAAEEADARDHPLVARLDDGIGAAPDAVVVPHAQPLPHPAGNALEHVAEQFGLQVAGAVEGFLSTTVSVALGAGGAQAKNIPLLIRLLETDESAEVRRTAAWGLNDTGDVAATAALIRALRQDAAVEVREMAAWALGGVGTPASLEALRLATRDESPQVRVRATWGLGRSDHREKTILDALAERLGDAEGEVRAMAAWAIGTLQPAAAPPRLYRESLRDADPEVRLLAGWALGQIADPAAQSALAEALPRENDPEALKAISRALLRLGPIDPRALESLLASENAELRAQAIRIAAGVGPDFWPWPWPWPDPRPLP